MLDSNRSSRNTSQVGEEKLIESPVEIPKSTLSTPTTVETNHPLPDLSEIDRQLKLKQLELIEKQLERVEVEKELLELQRLKLRMDTGVMLNTPSIENEVTRK